MRKFLSIIFMLLLVVSFTGLAVAHQMTYDPKTTAGGAYVSIPVYSDAALDAGDVVVWDVDASTGDNDMWVTTTTTADTGLVAGVVLRAIAAGDVGEIVIYGLAECDTDATGAGESSDLCTSTTAGAGRSCASGTAGYRYAITTAAIAASGQGGCFVMAN